MNIIAIKGRKKLVGADRRQHSTGGMKSTAQRRLTTARRTLVGAAAMLAAVGAFGPRESTMLPMGAYPVFPSGRTGEPISFCPRIRRKVRSTTPSTGPHRLRTLPATPADSVSGWSLTPRML